ncbi:MAG: SpoIIE family protein phosphatase [Chloroflexi bacterium]|nr:SpoIIE family protein phosphatase [Chloroflexota bacterium]MYD49764.1 SpoIIE family protein phosphatase [Chloroflexota bacterium]
MTDKAEAYRILVVDDEPDVEPLVLQRMRRSIRSGQYQFVFAQNGVEALQKLEQDTDIDMVLSDINMPQMDGLSLLERIPEVAPDTRSVIISAYGDMKNIRSAMNRGAFDFVTKPLDFDDLRVTIERTLNNLAAWREAESSRVRLAAIENELDVASKMQQSILPTEFPTTDNFEVFGNMTPAREVGGDFFDIFNLENGCIGLAIADVSGKGVPAALFMMASRTLLKGSAIGLNDPGRVLQEVNDLLYDDNDAMMFVTVLYAVYDPATRELTYANGGHNLPVIVHADGSNTVMPSTNGIALGILDGGEYEQSSITCAPGDTVVLYTDGVTEAINVGEEEFGMERLQGIFTSAPGDCRTAVEAVFDAVSDFAGEAPQFDDITCLALRVK